MKKFKRIVTVGHILSTFWSLFYAYYMLFRAQEVRSPTLQMMCKLELKQRSYGRLKTTHQAVRNFAAAKWATKISQPKAHFAAAKWNPLAKFRKVFHSCETTSKHTCATSQVETPFSQLRTTLRNHLQAAKQVANHLQVAETPPSYEITNSTCKIKVQTWKMDNSNVRINLQNPPV